MKLSDNTLTILKNFSDINANLVVAKGNKISTISEAKSVLANANVEETFDVEFGIFDLGQFLGAITLFDQAEFTWGENSVQITDEKSGQSIQYFYSDQSVLTYPKKQITLPESVVTFVLTQEALADLRKAGAVLQVSDLTIQNVKGDITITMHNGKDTTSNTYRIKVGKAPENADFSFHLKVDNLKLMSGEYKVEICEKAISKFTHVAFPLEYFVALEPSSKYVAK